MAKIMAGDLLFRYALKEQIDEKVEYKKGNINLLKIGTSDRALMGAITNLQKKKDYHAALKINAEKWAKNHRIQNPEKVLNMVESTRYAKLAWTNLHRIAHVGVVGKTTNVIEVGAGNAKLKNITDRKNQFDIVVRFCKKGDRQALSHEAKSVIKKFDLDGIYAWNDLGKIVKKPLDPSGWNKDFLNDKAKYDDTKKHNLNFGKNIKNKFMGKGYNTKLIRKVVCSHFVNALCFSAFFKKSFEAAIHKDHDKYFMVSPANLILMITRKLGMYNNHPGYIAGVQHQGLMVNYLALNRLTIIKNVAVDHQKLCNVFK